MQRTLSAILMAIGMLIGVFVLGRDIAIGEANNFRFYLLFISFTMLFCGGWYNYYKNRTQKGIK